MNDVDIRQNANDPYISEEIRKYLLIQLRELLNEFINANSFLGNKHQKSTHAMTFSLMIERVMCWQEWKKYIPSLKFDPSWEVTIIPPFSGAMIRFIVQKENSRRISVYLDCYDVLGSFGAPYWEIYPYENGTYRVAMNDTEELMKSIGYALDA